MLEPYASSHTHKLRDNSALLIQRLPYVVHDSLHAFLLDIYKNIHNVGRYFVFFFALNFFVCACLFFITVARRLIQLGLAIQFRLNQTYCG